MPNNNLINTIRKKVLRIRGHRVIIDTDLAALYQVRVSVFDQAIRRNIERLPEDFMFQLNKEEFQLLKSQGSISGLNGKNRPSFVFTAKGVAMLSSVIKTEMAARVNMQLMRIFTEQLLLQKKQGHKIESIGSEVDLKCKAILGAIKYLIES
ncbi:MAG: ORF6N domain-containing protein [Nitrospirae bacterium]|nr:ORF6N domain-containing protein [Nitrospirota bacterium]